MNDVLDGVSAHHAQTDRLNMRYLATNNNGDGACVVFVHGNVSSAEFWQDTMLALPRQLRAIAPDLRGFGGTQAVPIDASRGVRDFADDVKALIQQLGLGPVHLVGWSMGGAVALQYVIDHPDDVLTVTLINPMSPYGFGGTKGADGELCHPDGAGSGGGTANPEFVQLLAAGDRGDDHPNSPRNVMNSFYFRPPFRAGAREDDFTESMLSTRVGDEFYPGDTAKSSNWPGMAPGRGGLLNAISPLNVNLSSIVDVAPKPPILWLRGSDDLIVSDLSMFDMGALGQLGYVPGWPGTDVFPPQPMIAQTRAVLDRYQANGGAYREITIDGAGHAPHIEAHEAFIKSLTTHIFERT